MELNVHDLHLRASDDVGGRKDSVRIMSMPTYTGRMPGNLADSPILAWARMSSKSTLLRCLDGLSMERM